MNAALSRLLLAALFACSACAEDLDDPCAGDDDACLEPEPELLALLPAPPRGYVNVSIAASAPADGTVSATTTDRLGTCTAEGCTVRSGSRVTVTAQAVPGRGFARWSGCSSSTSKTLTLTARSTTTCTAVFESSRFDVVARSQPSLGGTVTASSTSPDASCSGNTCLVWKGSSVTLRAAPAAGFRFDGWSACPKMTSSRTLTYTNMQARVSCWARFSPISPYTLTAVGATDDGSSDLGFVYMSSPSGNCEVNQCKVVAGGQVSLQANPPAGKRFAYWSGCTNSTEQTTSVTVGSPNVQCIAHYASF